MTMAEKILSLRTARGMSQDDLAEQLGVSRQSVSKWETGQSTPDLDKIIKLSDLFGVTVDQLVREGERPRPPEPSPPQVVYVAQKRELSPVQQLGVVMEASGAALAVIGIMGAPLLSWAAIVSVLLGLPLLLAKKHPWLIAGWLAAALSLSIFNPQFSICPWGLAGGLRMLYHLIVNPAIRYPSYCFAAAVGIVRGLFTLVLLFFTWRAWKKRKQSGLQ